MNRYRIKIVWRYSSERFSIQKKGFLFWKELTYTSTLKEAQARINYLKNAEYQIWQFNREQEEQCEKL